MIADPRFTQALALALRVLSSAVVGATVGVALPACTGEGEGTTDGGCTQTVVEYTVTPTPGAMIGDIAAHDAALGADGEVILVGAGGAILRESGEPWASVPSGVDVDLHGIDVHGSIGVIVGDGGTILRSADGGKSWAPALSMTTADLRDVFLVDDSVGVAVGGDVIVRSIDGGATWAPVDGLPAGPLGFTVVSGRTNSGTLDLFSDTGLWLRSSDHGETWTDLGIKAEGIVGYSRLLGIRVSADGSLSTSQCEGLPIGAATAAVDPKGRWVAGADGQVHLLGVNSPYYPDECESPQILASQATGAASPIQAICSQDDEHVTVITADGARIDLVVTKASHEEPISCPVQVDTAGRPLLVDDAAREAPIVAGEGWAAVDPSPAGALALELDPAVRRRLAEAFARAGAAEHASIAAFARVILHLLALAAPAALIDATQAALADEVDHARRCLTLASTLAGEPLAPGPLAIDGALAGPIDLAAFALATLREGCVGETIAAAAAQVAAATCEAPAIRGDLARIADDEARHAALAWRTVAWALEVGGAPVRDALADAIAEIAAAQGHVLEDMSSETCPQGYGILAADERRAIAVATLRQVILPRARALLDAGAPRPSPSAEAPTIGLQA